MTDTPEARYGWLCVCGETNRDVFACYNCGMAMGAPVRSEAFMLWERIIRAEERERILRALEAEAHGDSVPGEQYIDAIDRAIAIVRGEV
jgi:hypothetical protein